MNGLLGPVTANPRMLAQALKAREQPRKQLTGQGLLDTAAIGLSPVPVIGDALGLAADASRFYNEPESRTPLNFGLAALGALPFVPSMSGIKFLSTGNGGYSVKLGDREIGNAWLSDNGPYLTSVRLEPEFQNKGIGSKLYDFIEKDSGKKLIPSPLFQSPQAQSLWKKRGE